MTEDRDRPEDDGAGNEVLFQQMARRIREALDPTHREEGS